MSPSYDESIKLHDVTDEEMERAFPQLRKNSETKPIIDNDQADIPLVGKPKDYHPGPEGGRR